MRDVNLLNIGVKCCFIYPPQWSVCRLQKKNFKYPTSRYFFDL